MSNQKIKDAFNILQEKLGLLWEVRGDYVKKFIRECVNEIEEFNRGTLKIKPLLFLDSILTKLNKYEHLDRFGFLDESQTLMKHFIRNGTLIGDFEDRINLEKNVRQFVSDAEYDIK